MTDEALVGYYDLYQISSTRETKRATGLKARKEGWA